MSRYSAVLRGKSYSFADLRDVMAKASPLRSGDVLAGVAAGNARERAAAQVVLADVPLERFRQEPLIAYESDEVTRLILDDIDADAFSPVRDLTVGQFREWLLAYETTGETLRSLCPGITPEMAAAVCKICRNQDLILIASKCSAITRFRNTLGLPGRLAVRLQPNHPTDDPKGIAAAILDGLLYGCGDAVIGINPATDNIAVSARTVLDVTAELIGRLRDSDAVVRAGSRDDDHRRDRSRARRSIWSSNPSPAPRRPTRVLASISSCWTRRIEAALSLKRGTIGDQRACISRPARGAASRPGRITASISRRSKPAPMPWRGNSSRCW